MTPDSQKSTAEQGTEKLTSLGDKAAFVPLDYLIIVLPG